MHTRHYITSMPKQDLKFQETNKSMDRTVDVELHFLLFREDNVHIKYCPAFDLSGYGKTEEQANESFRTTISEFFNYFPDKKTLTDIMKDMGWIIELRHSSMLPPRWEDLKRNANVKFIMSNYSYKVIEESVKIPALV